MEDGSKNSILRNAIFIIGFILIAKLFLLQIVNPVYKLKAKNNVVKKIIQYPSRGLILDRDGKLLVYNDPVYDIYVQCNQMEAFDTLELCTLLQIEKLELKQRLSDACEQSRYKPIGLLRQVSQAQFASFQEHLYKFEGFSYESRTVRRYPFRGAPHVLGYMSEVDTQDIRISDEYYVPGDYIGKTGLEKMYETELRGKKGLSYVIVNVFNRLQGSFNDGANDLLPKAGANLYSTLDGELQKYGEDLMQNKIGSVVAIEPSTGEVLAYISSPTYDPNFLTGRSRGNNFRALAQDSLKPLYNRPVLAEYPPGSTFKPIMSLMAYERNLRSPQQGYTCVGGYKIPGHFLKCHEHPPLVAGRDAIRVSCNAYYCDVLRRQLHHDEYGSVEEAYDEWWNIMSGFGYGKKLSIDLNYENSGNLPTSAYYNRLYGKHRWKATTVISLAIGQGEILATPLQMANAISTIANRGYYYTPHLLKGFARNDTLRQSTKQRNEVNVQAENFEYVIQGLEDVFLNGTARAVYHPKIRMAGKTGTAENPHGDDHSLFVSFAPVENPKIAIAVIVENAGFGSTYAAPIAALMSEFYIQDSIAGNRKYIEEKILEADLIHKE